MKYLIKKGYQVFEQGHTEPMDEPDEQALFGWLRNRGLTATEAVAVIEKVDNQGQMTLELPQISN